MSVANLIEREMLDLINQERRAAGLSDLKLEQRLNDSADEHSQWMLDQDIFSHTGVGGSSSNDRMVAANFDFSGSWRSAENIGFQSIRGAEGYSDDVEDIHNNLMNSSGHRANILNASHEYVGIGIRIGEYKGFTVVMITQNFAATDGQVVLDGGTAADPEPVVVDAPEDVVGTNSNDRLFGTFDDEELRGLGGNDLLVGRGGDDTISAGNGNDRLRGGEGADLLNGSSGTDTADYMGARTAVRVDLDVPGVNTGEAQGDTYISIESVIGSRYDDYLRGDAASELLKGWHGDDWLRGRAGNDTLAGGNGNDTLEGQEGTDRVIGGSGIDTFVFGPRMDRDIVVDFQDGVDVLDFQAFNFNTVSEAAAYAQQRNADVFFDFGSNDTLIIKNATIAEVVDDFLI
ncbi:CAP domain-containing protein [Sulfitobacter sp.]|uniref:CAP domain-containing protein n=1 Tax=Sulfitobacter sp. TaxID=1903071 RepID=UPI0030011E9F